MDETPRRARTARRRATTAAVCAVLVAVAGATISAPANAGTVAAVPCTSTPLTGIADGVTTGLAGCGTTTTAPTTAPTVESGPIDDAAAPTADPAPTATAAAHLSAIDLGRSTASVYPVRDGYLDDVRFSVRALDADGLLIPVHGTAVLTKGATIAKSWTLDGSTSVLTWNGRVGDTVRTGVYTLVVTAWSADGTQETERSRVRVVSKHVERRAVMVRSRVSTTGMHAAMPRQVMNAFATGRVTVRLRTVAQVTGPAKLVFSSNGTTRALRLRNGAHTTRQLTIPKGFDRVTLAHHWARGAAKLTSATAIWTYSALVP